jgi:ParB family chromosome partitioning protein
VDDPAKQLAIYEQIIKNHLSVRKVEELVRNIDQTGDDEPKTKTPLSQEHMQIEKQLNERFRVPVKFNCNEKGKGKITLSFRSDEELEYLMELFDKLN